jgi:hypothetical protein
LIAIIAFSVADEKFDMTISLRGDFAAEAAAPFDGQASAFRRFISMLQAYPASGCPAAGLHIRMSHARMPFIEVNQDVGR